MTPTEVAGAAAGSQGTAAQRQHALLISVEDWFQAAAMQRVVLRRHWPRLEPRLGRTLALWLELLQGHGAQATFFVSGFLAEQEPELVRRIAAAGHEVASSGFWPGAVVEHDGFAADLARARAVIEAASGREVLGFRAGGSLRNAKWWLPSELAVLGYVYDASLCGGRVQRTGGIQEVPASCGSLLGLRVPLGGSGLSRQLSPEFVQRQVGRWLRRHGGPLVCSFRTWELDLEQPRVTALPRLQRIGHYRHLERTRAFLERQLTALRFTSVESLLGLAAHPIERRPAAPSPVVAGEPPSARTAVSVVVPVCNEQDNLPGLLRAMDALAVQLQRHELELVLVDDGSRDGSWRVMQELAAARPRTQLLRHEHNRGIAAAITTGLRAARSEVVVSIDCDCSYDPAEIGALVALLGDADLVTASPYHPQGKVRNVPGWRLLLSRTLSWAYRRATGCRLYTWTSCFRAYRKSAVAGIELENDGFLGVAELLLRAVLRGRRVVEYPAMLESRLLGTSKLKTLRTIRGHLGLLWRVWRGRVK